MQSTSALDLLLVDFGDPERGGSDFRHCGRRVGGSSFLGCEADPGGSGMDDQKKNREPESPAWRTHQCTMFLEASSPATAPVSRGWILYWISACTFEIIGVSGGPGTASMMCRFSRDWRM